MHRADVYLKKGLCPTQASSPGVFLARTREVPYCGEALRGTQRMQGAAGGDLESEKALKGDEGTL